MKKAVSLIMGFGIAAASHASLIFQDNFDGYTLTSGQGSLTQGGWNVYGGNALGTVEETRSPFDAPSTAASMRDETYVDRDMFWNPTGGDVLTMTADMYIGPELNQGTFGFTLMNELGGNVANAEFNLQDRSLFGSPVSNIESFKLKITMDSATKTTSYFLDNVLVGSNVYSGPGDYKLSKFFMGTYEGVNDDGPVQVDNLMVYTGNDSTPVPEPATMAILGVGAFGLLRKRRK